MVNPISGLHLPRSVDRYPPALQLNFGNTMLLDKGGIDKSVTVDRDSIKYIMDTISTGRKLAVDTILPSSEYGAGEYLGGHGALRVETGVTNDVTDADNLDVSVSWEKVRVTVSGYGGNDPYGESNAQILTPDGANDYIEQDLGVDCAGVNVYGDMWIRAIAGTHTAQFQLRKADDSQILYVGNQEIGTSWRKWQKLVSFEAGVSNCVLRIVPSTGGANAIAVRMPFVDIDTIYRKSPVDTSRVADVADLDVSKILRGDRGSWYVELMMPGDIENGIFQIPWLIQPLKDDGRDRRLYFTYNNSNIVTWRAQADTPAIQSGVEDSISNLGMESRVFYKFAGNWNVDSMSLIKDSVVIGTAANIPEVGDAVLPSDAKLYLNNGTGLLQFDGFIRRLIFWNDKLPNSYLQEITS